ncbi:hypothetical protein Rsub_11052 [Raphidocelis subcapitata]|uniref:Uncharacterized protein n=1 Tax=Raphidocelis subcapitata TaxID=307507 RepID=A0A2V0PGV1_9CHLO|nr:hypothetical protein Rsub_11052 [Raphidocelis subcapitata]|eukprot:GBF98232.1 hypothetical protein Rsub_11052 [Raphidocelis subcapitata]
MITARSSGAAQRQRRRGGGASAALCCVLAALVARTADAALPNVDGVWLGNGSIALGLGTTFVVSSELGVAGGVQGVAGGYFDAGATCSDAANEQAKYLARWSGIQLTTSGAGRVGLEEPHTASKLSGVAQEDGAVNAASWSSNTAARKALRRVAQLPGDAVVIEAPNSYTGCVSRATAAESEIAGGAKSGHDGSHSPPDAASLDALPRLSSRGTPPFLHGYFVGSRAAGLYTPGGFSWANDVGGKLLLTQGAFLSYTCITPWTFRATYVSVGAHVNGQAGASAGCEVGQLDPKTGVLSIWAGKGAECPSTEGRPPSYVSVRVGKLANAPEAAPCKVMGGDALGGKTPRLVASSGAARAGSVPALLTAVAAGAAALLLLLL